jgi:hypothetical protein
MLALVLVLTSSSAAFSQWGPETRLTNDPSFSSTWQAQRSIDIDGYGNLTVVWYDFRDGNGEIYFKTWDGLSWSPDQRVAITPAWSGHASLAVDRGRETHVVWLEGGEIFYSRKTSTGWTTPENVSNDPADSWDPQIAVDCSGSAHVVWFDYLNGSGSIWYRKWDRALGTWDSATELAELPASNQIHAPSICLDGFCNPHVVWEHDGSEAGVFYSYKVAGTWVPPIRVSDSPSSPARPAIFSNGIGDVRFVWEEYYPYGSPEILYRERNSGVLESIERVTNDPAMSMIAGGVSDGGGNTHLTWTDHRDGNYEIYYASRRRLDGVWSQPFRVSNDPGSSLYASIAVDGYGAPHIVWTDDRNGGSGHEEIYYRRGSMGSAVTAVPEQASSGRLQQLQLRAIPNPMRCLSSVEIDVPRSGRVDYLVFDLRGRLVKHAPVGTLSAGKHILTWDGTGMSGKYLPAGVYFVKFAIDDQMQPPVGKITLLR